MRPLHISNSAANNCLLALERVKEGWRGVKKVLRIATRETDEIPVSLACLFVCLHAMGNFRSAELNSLAMLLLLLLLLVRFFWQILFDMAKRNRLREEGMNACCK